MTLYTSGKELLLTEWTTGDIKAQLVNNTYTYSAAHATFNTTTVPTSARLGAAVSVTGRASTGGKAIASDIVIPSVPAGTIAGVILFKDAGSGTGTMIYYGDSTRVPTFPITTSGVSTQTLDVDNLNGLFSL